MPDVVLITGLPATGKYTVATELVRQMEERGSPVKLVDNHYWNNVIFGLLAEDGKGPLPPEVWERTMEVGGAVWRTIEEQSPPDWSFVLTAYISGVDDEWFIDRIATLAKRRDSTYTVVELTCDVEELARRIDLPGRAERLKMTSVAGIRELAERGRPPIDRTDLVQIDTTDLAPDAGAEEILSRLATG